MHKIITQRLTLNELEICDATDVYVSWLNDPNVNKYLEIRHTVQSIESCKSFIEECKSDSKNILLGIFVSETGQHIGNAKIGFINNIHKRAQISLFIGDKDFWNKGYSTEVVKALTQYSFKTLNLLRLEAGCYEENMASLRVFLKCGYVVEGFMRSHVLSGNKRQGCFWLGILADDHND